MLIVDDGPLVRTHLRRLLELRGFKVRVANDGEAGLAAISLLLDVTMPVMDGVEVVRRLRAAGSRLPVVLCSGNLDYALEHGLEPGAVQGVLQKPFSTDELLAAIERARGA